jgi:hypothetical protein
VQGKEKQDLRGFGSPPPVHTSLSFPSLLPTISQQFPSTPLVAPVTAHKRIQKSLAPRRASLAQHLLHHKIKKKNLISFFFFPLLTILIVHVLYAPHIGKALPPMCVLPSHYPHFSCVCERGVVSLTFLRID